MLISVRDKDGNLYVKDMLDIDFDMHIKEKDGKYVIYVSNRYYLDEFYSKKNDAESEMIRLADCRNKLEDELRSWS